jgi:hypothetical protein
MVRLGEAYLSNHNTLRVDNTYVIIMMIMELQVVSDAVVLIDAKVAKDDVSFQTPFLKEENKGMPEWN